MADLRPLDSAEAADSRDRERRPGQTHDAKRLADEGFPLSAESIHIRHQRADLDDAVWEEGFAPADGEAGRVVFPEIDSDFFGSVQLPAALRDSRPPRALDARADRPPDRIRRCRSSLPLGHGHPRAEELRHGNEPDAAETRRVGWRVD